jgi:peptidyl-prolyl cis-trans isomerase C
MRIPINVLMTSLSLDSMPETMTATGRPPVYRYHLLRAALGAGYAGLAELDGKCLTDIERQADRSFDLESLVLSSPEAASVAIPPGRIEVALSELRGRYPDRNAFIADLMGNGLDEETLGHALERELIFDAVMQAVSSKRPDVTEIDERLFFELHKERFSRPERRTARHILITVNDEFEENRRDASLSRIERLAEKLDGRPNRFPSLAKKHSECPSAMEEGRLGTLSRGRLYPELDAVLFSLPEGGISGPVESDMGFHLLWCEKIHRGVAPPFSKVRPRIRRLLEERAARNCQKAWISALQRSRSSESTGVQGRSA